MSKPMLAVLYLVGIYAATRVVLIAIDVVLRLRLRRVNREIEDLERELFELMNKGDGDDE